MGLGGGHERPAAVERGAILRARVEPVAHETGTARQLIVNAERYGFDRYRNRDIERSVERGIVTSISAVTNLVAIDELPAFALRFPHISVGVHLNPLVGAPVADPGEVRSLIDAEGEFPGGREFARRLLTARIDPGELAHELRLQIERARLMGVKISHLDGLQNRHLYPGYFGVFLQLLKEQKRGACARRPATAHLATRGIARAEFALARRHGVIMSDRRLRAPRGADAAGQAAWSQLLRSVPEGWSEVSCPADLDVMTSLETLGEIEHRDIQLRTFHDLARSKA